eukprot:GEMP01051100.1.p1 GENE.GEMP01051100.1~~GEMP01051100.1.p1  ORF type:complete len:306 (+),score=70.56 GEMP01051100.1:89-1006(+)
MTATFFDILHVSGTVTVGIACFVFFSWLFYNFFFRDPFDVKPLDSKKELRIYTMDERPWPKKSPFGGLDETETVEQIIRRLWAKLPKLEEMLVKRVNNVRLAHLWRGKLSHFMLIYTTKDGVNIFAGPPTPGSTLPIDATDMNFDSFDLDEYLDSLMRYREGGANQTKVWPMQEVVGENSEHVNTFEEVYSIHDGFGVVLQLEKELWILASDAGVYADRSSTWYLLPRRAMWQIELNRFPLSLKTPCIAFGRIDRHCDAVAVNGDMAFFENGDLVIPPTDERVAVDTFVEETLKNIFGDNNLRFY